MINLEELTIMHRNIKHSQLRASLGKKHGFLSKSRTLSWILSGMYEETCP